MTKTTTQTVPCATAPVPEVTAPDRREPAPSTAPALNPPVWSGRKTAIAAALAIGISAMGAAGAATALPVGSTQSGTGQFQPGGVGGRGQGGVGGRGQGGLGQPGTVPQQGTVPQNPNVSTT
ncbi:MAG: hypothetical protein ABIQ13_04405 [Pedococcus sp.]